MKNKYNIDDLQIDGGLHRKEKDNGLFWAILLGVLTIGYFTAHLLSYYYYLIK